MVLSSPTPLVECRARADSQLGVEKQAAGRDVSPLMRRSKSRAASLPIAYAGCETVEMLGVVSAARRGLMLTLCWPHCTPAEAEPTAPLLGSLGFPFDVAVEADELTGDAAGPRRAEEEDEVGEFVHLNRATEGNETEEFFAILGGRKIACGGVALDDRLEALVVDGAGRIALQRTL
jgi:hypothetical protein